MATNRPDTLDPALMRPGRLDRKVEFGLPDLEGRSHIFKIHARSMSVERDIRFELLARLCPNSTGQAFLFFFCVLVSLDIKNLLKLNLFSYLVSYKLINKLLCCIVSNEMVEVKLINKLVQTQVYYE